MPVCAGLNRAIERSGANINFLLCFSFGVAHAYSISSAIDDFEVFADRSYAIVSHNHLQQQIYSFRLERTVRWRTNDPTRITRVATWRSCKRHN
jgi:hypothetical protein